MDNLKSTCSIRLNFQPQDTSVCCAEIQVEYNPWSTRETKLGLKLCRNLSGSVVATDFFNKYFLLKADCGVIHGITKGTMLL